jgi:hypothetical protein
MGMLAKTTRIAVLRLSAEGHGSRRIASLLSVARGSVRRVVRSAADDPPKLNRPSTAPEMKQAISRHFVERNEHFHHNPRRAGKKIWDLDFFQDVEAFRAGDYRKW